MGGITEKTAELPSLVEQILSCSVQVQTRQRFNPRPAGVIQQGSATEAVLQFLESSAGMRTEAQIRWATGRNHASVSWALLRLRRWGLVQCVADESRNARYLRYAAVKE
jgi:hypothetical protein